MSGALDDSNYLKWPCDCCGKRLRYDTDYFMLTDRIWEKAVRGLVRRGELAEDWPWQRWLLCVACTERGLNRTLVRGDFTTARVNRGVFGFDFSNIPHHCRASLT